MGVVGRILGWFYHRLNLEHLPLYRVPYNYFNLDHWIGAIVAAAFMWLAITGLLLLVYYSPSAPYESSLRIVNEIPFGKILLSSHLYAAHLMIFSAYIHLFRNYFVASYKKPRELLWIIGILAGLLTLNTAFLGYALVGDIVSADAINVGKGVVAGIFGPELGTFINNLVFGTGGEETYTRLLAFHIISAALLGLMFMAHMAVFEAHGPPPDVKEVRWKASINIISQDRKDLVNWFPHNFIFIIYMTTAVWGILLFLVSLALSAGKLHPLISPVPGPSPTSPEAAEHPPYPPWFFLFMYKVADFVFLTLDKPIVIDLLILKLTIPESPILLPFILSVALPVLYLVLLPFIDTSIERHPLKRPVITIIGALLITYLIQTTVWGALTPGQHVSLELATILMVPPIVIIALGVAILSKIHTRSLNNEISARRAFMSLGIGSIMLASTGFFITISVVRSIFNGATVEDLIAGGLGFAGLLLGMYIIINFGSKSRHTAGFVKANIPEPNDPVQEKKVQETERVSAVLKEARKAEEEIPLSLLIMGTIYLVIILASGFLLANIDPIEKAVAVGALMSSLLISLGGIAHIVHRTLLLPYDPYKGGWKEYKVHTLLYFIIFLNYILVSINLLA